VIFISDISIACTQFDVVPGLANLYFCVPEPDCPQIYDEVLKISCNEIFIGIESVSPELFAFLLFNDPVFKKYIVVSSVVKSKTFESTKFQLPLHGAKQTYNFPAPIPHTAPIEDSETLSSPPGIFSQSFPLPEIKLFIVEKLIFELI
jgi:hypothetical protein